MSFVILTVTTGILAAQQAPEAASRRSDTEHAMHAGAPAEFARCKVGALEARCGRVEVPERRDAEKGRTLELFVAVVPARSATPAADPIVVLEGGPGASVTHFGGLHAQTFAGALEARDLVLFDQRGTGRSEGLDCPSSPDFTGLPQPAEIAACREELSTRAGLAHYTTAEAVADLAEVLDRLGYQRANLFAVSNGTRTALRFLARHEDRVRTLTLLAPYPMSRNALVDGGRTLDRSLALLTEACAADDACAADYGELGATIAELPERFADDEGWPVFAAGVRMMLFFPLQASRVPQLLHMVESAGRLPEPSAGPQEKLLSDWISRGAFFSILCSEDAARTDPDRIETANGGTFLGPGWALNVARACREWPRKNLPEDFENPVSSDVPALLLVGRLDPAMPPAWAHEVASTLPNATVVEVAEGAHSFIGMRGVGCVVGLMNAFFQAGSAADLDTSCVAEIRRPPFARAPR